MCFSYFSTYLWLSASLAIKRFVGSRTSSDFIKCFASVGESANNSSISGFVLDDFIG